VRWLSIFLFVAGTGCVGSLPESQDTEQDPHDVGSNIDASVTDASGEAQSLTVAVVSDLNGSYGSTTYDALVHTAGRRLVELDPDLVLSTGDMVAGQKAGLDYPAMWAGFHQAISDRLQIAGIPFAVTPGNHDASAYSGFAAERGEYAAQWSNRRPNVNFIDDSGYPFNYVFSLEGALFISLDSTTVGSLSALQMLWLADILAKHAIDYDPVIIFGHVPLYPFAQGRETEVIGDENLESLLTDYGVDLFISGHHHAYYPGKRSDLRLVSTACLGGGARKLIGIDQTSAKSMVVFEIENGEIVDLQALAGADLDSVVNRSSLPASVGSGSQVIVRDDL
jgi:3',5'-cyclic AMP phosphodiesterase CpdA